MAEGFRKSDSIEYALEKWFDEMSQRQSEYLEILCETISRSKTEILEVAKKLSKIRGKKNPEDIQQTKQTLIENARNLEPQITELNNYAHNYKTLIEEIDGFEFNITTAPRLLEMIKEDIDTIDKYTISMKDLVKAANVAFKQNQKQNKKLEEDYIQHLKNFSALLKEMDNDIEEINAEFDAVFKELKSEVEHAKQLGKAKVA
jgi:ABC-type transporter Mla subunit MlaD